MFLVNSYVWALVLCVVIMLCWGSWGNTQKLASKNWRFELFYWDYVIGIVLFSLLVGFTLGSTGGEGPGFVENLQQVSGENVLSCIIGGVIFNAANILLTAAVAITGLAIAWPVGLGIALVLGVVILYVQNPSGNPLWLGIGVALIMLAVLFNGIASGKNSASGGFSKKGTVLSVVAGVLMALFSPFVMNTISVGHMVTPDPGTATPYVAFFLMAVGVLLSNFVFNTIAMRFPVSGERVSYKDYFAGTLATHIPGILGGSIWAIGTLLSYICAEAASPAVAYALGQGSPMIATIWGVFIWKEFKGSSKTVDLLLVAMFVAFVMGLGFIVATKV